MKNLPLFGPAPEEIRGEIFEMLKNKRDKYRSEIRNCRLSAELNLKRFKESTQKREEIDKFTKNSNENRLTFYEEIWSFLEKVNEKTEICDINNVMSRLKQLIFEDLEHCATFIKRFSILDHVIGFFDEIYDDCFELQYNCLWNFSNIVYFIDDEYILRFLDAHPEIFPYLLHFLKKCANNHKIIENVFLAIGNIAGKSNEVKRKLLEENIVMNILNVFEKQERKFSTLNEALWVISNLCIENHRIDHAYNELKKFLPLLKKSLLTEEVSLYENALWCFAHLSDGDDEQVKDVLDLGITAKFLSLAVSDLKEIKTPAVRTVCNLLTSDDEDTQILIDNGVFDCFFVLIDDDNRVIRKEVSWGISNLLACNGDIIEALCSHELINKVFNHCYFDEHTIKEELLVGLAAACPKAYKNELMFFMEKEIIELFLDVLEYLDSKPIVQILKGIDCLLGFLASQTQIRLLYEKKLKDHLEELQYHPDVTVCEECQKIIEKYFSVE